MRKLTARIYTKIFIPIVLTLTQLCGIDNGVYATDVDFREVEASLGFKQNVECTKQPCAVDIDDLLDTLNSEYVNEKGNVKLIDTQEKKEKSQNLPLIKTNKAELIVLNKITAKSVKRIFHLGEVQFFGNLSIEIHKCIKSSDPFNNNDLMLLTIFDNKIEDDNLSVFHGWIFSFYPSISTLEHPVYEVIPVSCVPKETS
jgi:hypothetical protein